MAHMSEDLKSPIELHKSGIPFLLKLIIILLVVLLLGASGFFAYQYFRLQKQVKSDVQLSGEPKGLIAEVGRLIELPLNEEPTIATVSDVKQLQGQPFFASARNGDKVLIYQKAKKAILYRPSTKKIIDVGPVNVETSESAEKAVEEKVSVALYNGTKRAGLTRRAESQLKEEGAEIEVLEKENAKLDYKETVVIDISGKQKARAGELAKIVGGKVANFPKGEATTSAQILIILGDNYETE